MYLKGEFHFLLAKTVISVDAHLEEEVNSFQVLLHVLQDSYGIYVEHVLGVHLSDRALVHGQGSLVGAKEQTLALYLLQNFFKLLVYYGPL